ncbi:MAG: putative Ig domain-containing protein, partial [Terriglobales bacterium]
KLFTELAARKESSRGEYFASFAASQDTDETNSPFTRFARPEEPFADLGAPAPDASTGQPSEMKQPPGANPTGNNGAAANPAAASAGGGAGVGGVSTPAAQGGGSPGGGGGGNTGVNQLAALANEGAFSGPAFTANAGTVSAPVSSAPVMAQPHTQIKPLLLSPPPSPPPPTVQFVTGTNLTTQETAGQTGILVSLSAASSQTVTVQYATSNGTALAGTDYTAESGTLSFAPGTTSASFLVPILDDQLANETSPETVNLTLSNPSGATLGTPSTAALTISEDTGTLSWSTTPPFSWTQTTTAAPTITTPSGQTTTEGNSVSLQIQASDPNSYPLSYDAVGLPPGLSISSTTGLISGTVAYGAAADFGGSYNPTVIVANNQGGSAQTTFAWTINQAQVAPTLTNPGSQTNLRGDNVSLQINASQVDSDALTYDATNLPTGLSIDSNTGLISGTVDPTSTLGTPYAVSVTATDEATNLTASQTFNWTINATNVAPVLTSPGNQTNAAGDVVSLSLAASDADGDSLTYTASGLPPGLALDPVAGVISGTLPNSAASSTAYTVTVTASDGMASSSQTFTWTVASVGLTNPGNQSNLDGDVVSLQLIGVDAANLPLTYSATNLPPGLSIASTTGLISGTIASTANNSIPYAVTVTATDGTHSASQAFNWSVAKLALNAPGNQENQEGTAVSLQLSVTDVGGTPSYSATGLPVGLSVNATTGLISGTIGVAAHGSSPYQVTVTATDGVNTSSQSLVWTVTPRVSLVNPGNRGDATGDTVSIPVTATSPGGTMSYTATGLPAGVSINSTTGLISGTIATGAASATPYTVTLTASDGTSSSSQIFQWTVAAVYLVPPSAQTNLDGDAVSLSLTTDYHGTGTLSYSGTGLPT